jgi:hypothetical protein
VTDDDVEDIGERMLENISARIDQSRIVEYERALAQVRKHLENDSLLMQKAFKTKTAGETAQK